MNSETKSTLHLARRTDAPLPIVLLLVLVLVIEQAQGARDSGVTNPSHVGPIQPIRNLQSTIRN